MRVRAEASTGIVIEKKKKKKSSLLRFGSFSIFESESNYFESNVDLLWSLTTKAQVW